MRASLARVLAVSFTVLALVPALGGAANAQDATSQPTDHATTSAAPQTATAPRSAYAHVTTIDITDADTLEGHLVGPDDDLIQSRIGAGHTSLIRLRANFVPEILGQADQI
jgi:hypothetical protein